MSLIHGDYYAAGRSARQAASLELKGGDYRLLIDNMGIAAGPLTELEISSRLAHVPRRIRFVNGDLFETADNESVDKALQQGHSAARQGSRLHRLESRWSLVIVSTALIASLLLASLFWGVPMVARAIAMKLPVQVTHEVSRQTLATLDQTMFEPSALPKERQFALAARFTRLVRSVGATQFDYQLHFRSLGENVPNAFALPSGDIVLTDALVAMAQNDAEIDAVLLHEIGHVELRHGLQQVISGAILAVGAAYVAGDVSGGQELLTGLPLFLTQQTYSREAEIEADEFAFRSMLQSGADPACFASIMQKMDASAGVATEQDSAMVRHGKRALEYASSHPMTESRMENAIESAVSGGVQRQCAPR